MAKKGVYETKTSKKDLYTLEELSQLLGIDERVLRRWCERGEIECVKTVGANGVVYAVREEDLVKLVEKLEEEVRKREKIGIIVENIQALLGIAGFIGFLYFFIHGFISFNLNVWGLLISFIMLLLGGIGSGSNSSITEPFNEPFTDDYNRDDDSKGMSRYVSSSDIYPHDPTALPYDLTSEIRSRDL